MDHQHAIELIPAYALGVLSEPEQQEVQAHLHGCAKCQAELKSYQGTLDALVLASPLREPTASLRQSIMEKAARTAKWPVAPRPDPWRGLLDRMKPLVPAWGVASLVLLVIMVLNNFLLWQRLDKLESSTSFQVVALTGSENAPEASGLLVISSDGMEGSLVVEHLPALSDDAQYQLWLIRDGTRTSGGVFSVDQEGYAVLHVDSDVPLSSFEAFGVTIEPEGGSPGPTGKNVLGGGGR